MTSYGGATRSSSGPACRLVVAKGAKRLEQGHCGPAYHPSPDLESQGVDRGAGRGPGRRGPVSRSPASSASARAPAAPISPSSSSTRRAGSRPASGTTSSSSTSASARATLSACWAGWSASATGSSSRCASLEPADGDPAELVPEPTRRRRAGRLLRVPRRGDRPSRACAGSSPRFAGDADFRARLRVLPATQDSAPRLGGRPAGAHGRGCLALPRGRPAPPAAAHRHPARGSPPARRRTHAGARPRAALPAHRRGEAPRPRPPRPAPDRGAGRRARAGGARRGAPCGRLPTTTRAPRARPRRRSSTTPTSSTPPQPCGR